MGMNIRVLRNVRNAMVDYAAGIYSETMGNQLSDAAAKGLVDIGAAVNLARPGEIVVSRNSIADDSGFDPAIATSASALTYTLVDNISRATRIRQDGAGLLTVQGDASVQMIGAGGSVITSLATTGIGSMILIEPMDLTTTPKKYLVIKGGA